MNIKLLLLIILVIITTGLSHAAPKSYNQAHGNLYTFSWGTRPNPVLMNKFLTTLQKGYAIRNQTVKAVQTVQPVIIQPRTSLKPIYINGIEHVLINGVYVPVDND